MIEWIVPVTDVNSLILLDRDEHLRPGTDMQALASLKPSFGFYAEQGGFDAVALADGADEVPDRGHARSRRVEGGPASGSPQVYASPE